MPHPIPAGHHAITPHLVIKGAAEAEIEFYKRAFVARRSFPRVPSPGKNGQAKLGHAELKIGDSRLFLSDEFPGRGVVGPGSGSPVTLHLYVTDADIAFARAVRAACVCPGRRRMLLGRPWESWSTQFGRWSSPSAWKPQLGGSAAANGRRHGRAAVRVERESRRDGASGGRLATVSASPAFEAGRTQKWPSTLPQEGPSTLRSTTHALESIIDSHRLLRF